MQQVKQKALIEFINRDTLMRNPIDRFHLIQILCRTSNLPKIQNMTIKILEKDPNGFKIDPGKSLYLGSGILTNPVVALVYIRYGLEWQIWYKSQSPGSINSQICDIAATQACAKFYDTLSLTDKKELLNLPLEFFNILKRFKTDHDLPVLSAQDSKILQDMHNLSYPETYPSSPALNAIRNLAYPLEYLLMTGGDKRLKIDRKRLLNKYGCTPFPRPKAYTFASSTATSISNIAFNQTEKKRQELIRLSFQDSLPSVLKYFAENIKLRIRTALDLSEDNSIILAPSGTDVSLIFAGICQSLFTKPIAHILVASDETGSGVPAALQGKHFSDLTSQKKRVSKGDPIQGFAQVDLIKIDLRNEKGELKSASLIDREVELAFERVITAGKQPILHVMNQSKLGYVAPSKKCLNKLNHVYDQDLFSLIDNSQMRMGRQELKNYISHGYAMTVTGSKFFTAPPFCGALILPKESEKRMALSPGALPEGLQDYVFKNDFPSTWSSTQDLAKGYNIGTLMRWNAALIEMERYFETPELLRELGSEMFCSHVENSIQNTAFLEGLFKDESASIAASNRSIFPFFILKNEKVLSFKEVSTIYQLLNQKLSAFCPKNNFESGNIGDQVCHIGQPVKTIYKNGEVTGVVRISLGARVLSESWKDQDVSLFFQSIGEQIHQVDAILRKIEYILHHPEWWMEKT